MMSPVWSGGGQVAHRADASQWSRTRAPVWWRRLVWELQREQLLWGDGHQRGDCPHGQEAHLQGKRFIFVCRCTYIHLGDNCHIHHPPVTQLHRLSLRQVRIREATGLPLNLSNFVFCQYTFWEHGEPTVAPPMVSPDRPSPRSPDAQFTVQFDHCKVSERELRFFLMH